MDELRELVSIVTKQKLRAASLLTVKALQPGPLSMRLYNLIAEGKVETDEQAMAELYPGRAKTVSYQRIKKSLRKYLVQMLLVIDLNLPHYNSRQKAYFEAYKNWGAIKLLLGKNAHQTTLTLAGEVLRTSQRYDFTDLALDMVRTLRLYHGSIEGNLKKYEKYGKQVERLEKVFYFENLAEDLYTDLVIRFINNKSTKREVPKIARAYFNRIAEGLKAYDSYRLHFTGRLIEIIIYTSVNDYKNTIAICDKAIRFFDNKPYVANVPLQVFLYQEMVCYVQLRDYPRGRKAADRGLKLLEYGSFNWFKYQELLLLLSLHARQYQNAYTIYKDTIRHRRFKSLPGSIVQIWKIFEAYLYYLIQVERIEVPEGETVIKRVRMMRFVNDVPIFSKDKRGLNIPVLIFQILYLILTKEYDNVIDRMEAIQKYSSRYLKKDDNYRSNCFIKMVLQIADSGFHRAAVIRNAEKHVKNLEGKPLDFANQSHDIEIIPYEDLWQMALDSLENTIYKPRIRKKKTASQV
ncbi:MAG: hypothetical protein EP344_00550 [Bacteroidetes bacterium]|nr:MAG: hypothetical protein EP344_00550 [Bacteroidota bacterium]